MRHAVDLIIEPEFILPIVPARKVLEQHVVVIEGDRITNIIPAEEAHQRFAARDVIRLDHHVLLPGFVNLHAHAAMSVMRSLADDLPLMTWLQEHIWPAEGRHLSPGMVEDGTMLAGVEMLRGGITCFNDMYFFPDAAITSAHRLGMRICAGITLLEFPTAYAPDADTYLDKGLAVRDLYAGNPLVSFCIAPHAPYTVSDKSFERVATLARQLDLPIHLHLHETADEITNSLREHGVRPIERLDRLGLIGPDLIGVHAVHLSPNDIQCLAYYGAHIAHCPSSNLKLASGIAPIHAAQQAGINIGLGTDSAASNNRLDLWTEMRTAALLAKGSSGDARAVDAHAALAMATINGARALGLEDQIGSIEPGKHADLMAVRLDDMELMPRYDIASHLVYSAGREHVSHVWVNGRQRVRDRQVVGIDTAELRQRALAWQNRLKT